MSKVTNKKFMLICTLVNALIMTAIISSTLTILNAGIENFSFLPWLRSWGIAFILVFGSTFFLPKLVRGMIGRIIQVKEVN